MMINNNPNETNINRQLSNQIESGSQLLMHTQTRFNSIFNAIVNNQHQDTTTTIPTVATTDMSFRNEPAQQRIGRNSSLFRHTSQTSDDNNQVNSDVFDEHDADLVNNAARDIHDSQDIVLDLTSNAQQNQDANEQQTTQQQQPQSLMKMILMSLQTNVPIILILVAKVFHRHLFGFFVILAFLATLHWCNRCLIKQIELKEKRSRLKVTLLILFVVGNTTLFFFTFSEYKIQYALIFLTTNIKKMDIWHLIWLVICCDITLKLIAMSFKSFVILMPFQVLPLRKRGSYFSMIEVLTSFYRSLIPIHPWIVFLLRVDVDQMTENSNDSSIFPAILCVLYILFKINHIYNTCLELSQVIIGLYNEQTYGLPVAKVDLEDTAVCPICQDKYNHPIKLKCKHIFCHDCASTWLDKEQTCPMCRAKILSKKPTFKDGSTTYMVQWY